MARVCFRVLLALYPERLRRERGVEMWETFEYHLRDTRREGLSAVVKLWLGELRAACTLGWRARRREAVVRRRGPGRSSWRNAMGAYSSDLRHALRSFRRSPGFLAVVVATLAIGIGAHTAIFSVVNGVLLHPLPYRDADELVMVWGRFLPESGYDLPQFELCEPEYLDYRDESRAMEDVAAFAATFGLTITGEGVDPEYLRAASVTANLFSLLGAAPALGRGFSAGESLPGGPKRVIISHELWQRRFGGSSDIVGSSISLNARTQEVIGVMPRGFGFPESDLDIWTPLQIDPSRDRTYRGNHYLKAVARLAPEVTPGDAAAELDTIMKGWEARYPDVHRGHFLFVRSLMDEIVAEVRPALRVLLTAVVALWIIACANVANLLLARSESRQREMAVRTALGAGRFRVVRQLLTESSFLALLGGLAGLLLAKLTLSALLKIDPSALPRGENVSLDAFVFGYTGLLTLATALALGLVPLLSMQGKSWHQALRDRARGATSGKLRLGPTLVVAEVALSLVLVVGAGLIVKSFEKLTGVDPGFRPAGTLVARVSLPSARYPDSEGAARFYRDLLARLRSLPGVAGASAASFLPLIETPPNNDIRIEGRPEPASGELKPSGSMVMVTPGYFEQMGIELLRGRTFEESDRVDRLPVAIISKSLAAGFWPNENPIGQRFDPNFNDVRLTIVGVVDDVKHQRLDVEARGAWYFPYQQAPIVVPWVQRPMSVVLQSQTEGAEPLSLAPALQASVRQLDPSLVLTGIRTMEDVLYTSVADNRFTATLLAVLAALALSLGAVGLYGVMSYTVARRWKEIGIRAALGATRGRIVKTVLGQGMALAGLGGVLGLCLSVATSHVLSSLLFGVSPTDPAILGMVTAVLAPVAALATWLPAMRAARLDPITTLRED